MTCRPDHAPRHPDFEPGNSVALTHGTRSERTIAARLPETRADVLRIAPWLGDISDQMAVDRFIRAETRARMLDRWIVATVEARGPQAVKAWAWDQARAADRLAAELGHSLGLDPIGRVRLQAATAAAEKGRHDLARIWQEDGQAEDQDGDRDSQ